MILTEDIDFRFAHKDGELTAGEEGGYCALDFFDAEPPSRFRDYDALCRWASLHYLGADVDGCHVEFCAWESRHGMHAWSRIK